MLKDVPTTAPAFGRFVMLYVCLYAAYGVASPFLPALLESRGFPAEQIGLVFAVGTAVKLVAAPLAGRLADHWAIRRQLVSARCVLFDSRRDWDCKEPAFSDEGISTSNQTTVPLEQ